MDEQLKNAEMAKVWKPLHEEAAPLEQVIMVSQWDSVTSHTQSLAQERGYQQQLPEQQGHNKCIPSLKENNDCLHQRAGQDQDADAGDLLLCDSLEIEAYCHHKTDPIPPHSDFLETQLDKRKHASQLLDHDSDLHYDHDGRTKVKGVGAERPQYSLEESEGRTKQQTHQTRKVAIKESYIHIGDTTPAARVAPQTTGNKWDLPYHLHPQDSQISAATYLHHHNHTLQHRSIKQAPHSAGLVGPTEQDENSTDHAGENTRRSPELTLETINAMYNQGYQTYFEQEIRCTNRTMHVPSTLAIPKVLRKRPDIVERNKITLGRTALKKDSYLSAHSLKQDTAHNLKKVHEDIEQSVTAESVKYTLHPDSRWLQKTQQQKPQVTQTSKEASPSPPHQKQSPACLTQPKPPKMKDSIISFSPLHVPNWSPGSEAQLALSSIYPQRFLGESVHVCSGEKSEELEHRNMEKGPKQWQRATAFTLQLCEEEERNWSPDEDKECLPNPVRSPTTTWPQGSGPFRVLPPIGNPNITKVPQQNPDQNTMGTYHIHRSSSDGYLAQMEKQQRRITTYKAYSLKDYKQLMPSLNLRGLGPDYTAMEETAEKMKRQKLYSNVIREQNKKISRIPSLPAKDPVGDDKKVPRMKALEYAKTIPKPPAQSRAKPRGSSHHPADLAASQLSTVELLKKQHEEGKQAVALFRKDL